LLFVSSFIGVMANLRYDYVVLSDIIIKNEYHLQ